MRSQIIHDDSRYITLGGDLFDAMVTDPPSGANLFGEKWDEARDRQSFITRIHRTFFNVITYLKPGAYGLVWALPRTSHWTARALEEAGFEIKDSVHHVFGQGMPKNKGRTLKPAHEVWWLVRNPGRGGTLNVGACRIGDEVVETRHTAHRSNDGKREWNQKSSGKTSSHVGRHPPNFLLAPEVATDEAAKLFTYTGKAPARERNQGTSQVNTHPTPKSVELMRYLVRLVTPEGGSVIDPFAGTGTTIVAAILEGRSGVGIEQDEKHVKVAREKVRAAEWKARRIIRT